MVGDDMESQVRYGQELGVNLMKVAKTLIKNQNLLMLLDNTDLDPLDKTKHPNTIDGLQLLNKLIRVVPLLTSEEQNTKSKIVLLYTSGQTNDSNIDNENLTLQIIVYCPFSEWLIAGDTLRPFAIMSEIRRSIQNKRINGLGEIIYNGFNLGTLTEQMGSYIMDFEINAFN